MALNDSICCMEKFFDPLLTQNRIGTGSSGRKQRKIHPANSGKQHKTESKRLRFFSGTTYGPEGRGFESLTACHYGRKPATLVAAGFSHLEAVVVMTTGFYYVIWLYLGYRELIPWLLHIA